MVMVLVFAFIVVRGLSHSLKNEDAFIRLGAAGLIVMFGVQSVINMSVNLNLMPAKGMTLPFISYGGSSMLALAFQMGLVLALVRRRFEPIRLTAPDFARLWRRAERGLILTPNTVAGTILSAPAAPAAICSRPRRWRMR